MSRLFLGASGVWLLLASSALAGPPEGDAQLAAPAGMARLDWTEHAVYPVIATPGRITDIALEPGEALVETGAIAAGDTARWVIGDTTSGAGSSRRVHVLVKPTAPDLATNLLINTDRRTYHLELRASARTWQAQVSWRYPTPPAPPVVATPPAPVRAAGPINHRYRIEGDHPSWRPLAAHDDGQRVYLTFGADVQFGDLPPLYRLSSDGKTRELINYRIEGRQIVVDRLFDRVELRLGLKSWGQRVRVVRLANAPEAR